MKSSSTDSKIDLTQNVCYDKHNSVSLDVRAYTRHEETLSVLRQHYKFKNIEVGYGISELAMRLKKIFHSKKLSMSVCEAPWRGAMQFDLPDGDDVYYLVNPNGNNGQVMQKAEVIKKARRHKYLVVDEAYGDFANESLIDEHINNIIVLKTLSKSYALPIARFGWCVANEKIIEELKKFRPVSSNMTAHNLKTILEDIPNHVDRMIKTRTYLEKKFDCVASKGNYVLFKEQNKYTKKFGSKYVNGLYRMALVDLATLGGA
jgi:hypothetical protein